MTIMNSKTSSALLRTIILLLLNSHYVIISFGLRIPILMQNIGKSYNTGRAISELQSTSPNVLLHPVKSQSLTTAVKAANDSDQSNREIIYSSTTNRKKKKIRPEKAPLVDSTLLRFLSAQKSQISLEKPGLFDDNNFLNGDDKDNYDNFNGNDGEDDDIQKSIDPALNYVNSLSSSSKNEINNNSSQQENRSTDAVIEKVLIEDESPESNLILDETETSSSSSSTSLSNADDEMKNWSVVSNTTTNAIKGTDAKLLSWFTQYNAYQVAKRLTALGATEKSAFDAGNSVQNYVLARTTRQRIRKFLRDRDNILWTPIDEEEMNNNNNNSYFVSDKKLSIVGDGKCVKNSELSDMYEEAALRSESYCISKNIDLLCSAGLTGKDIAAIFCHTPSVSVIKASSSQDEPNSINSKSITLDHILQKAYFGLLCETLKLRKYDARKVLRSCPGLLTKRGSNSAKEVISIFASLNVSTSSLCRDKAALPILLSRPASYLFRLVAFLSSDAVRMPFKNIGPFLRRSECAKLLDNVAPLPEYSLKLMGLTDEDKWDDEGYDNVYTLDALLSSGDSGKDKLIQNTYKHMAKTAKYLRETLFVEDLGIVLSAYPEVLLLELEKQIIPVVEFLEDVIGLDVEDIAKIIEMYPQLLGAEVEQMSEVVDYLLSLEVDQDMLASIFCAFPSLLLLDVQTKMVDVVQFLRSIGVTNIGRFITRLPPVLGYSVTDELLPKWQFLTKVCQYASFEIVRFPAYFSYPLDRVIISRYEYLLRVKRLPVQLLPVDEVLRFGDNDFATEVAKDEDVYSYARYVANRNEMKRLNPTIGKSKRRRVTGVIESVKDATRN